MALPIINLSLIPTFPARVFGSGPITVVKTGLDYTFGFDVTAYSYNPAPADLAQLLSFNPSTEATELIPVGDLVRPIASQDEAEAGSNNTKTMTPLRTKQSIVANGRYATWERGPSVVRSAQDIATNGWTLFDFINPAKHAAIQAGTELSDLTTSIQSAIDSGEGLKAGRGVYYISGVDLKTTTRLSGDGKDKVKFVLSNGSNRSAFRIPLTDPATGDFEQPVLEDFFVDANGNAQSGTSYAVELPNAAFDMSTSYGSAVTMTRVQLESGRSGNLWSGTNRGAGFINDCIFRYALNDVVTLNGYDWRIKGGDIGGSGVGGSATGNALTLASGGAIVLLGVNIFNAPQIGVAVSPLVNSFVDIIGCSLDLHGRQALSVSGAAGQRVALIGGRVGSNSKESGNTYSHLLFSNTGSNNVVAGTLFERGSPVAKHIAEFQGTCDPILWQGVYSSGGSAPFATALTNDFLKLKNAGAGAVGWIGPSSDNSFSLGFGSAEVWKAFADRFQINKEVRHQAATPRIWLQETDAAANSGRYMLDVEAGELRLFLVDDAESTFVKVLSLTRSGTALGRLQVNVTGGKFSVAGLPTSATGLSTNDWWNDGGTPKIVP